jgi:hypothetical protein
MSGHTINVTALAFADEGRLMANAAEKTIVWDAQTGQQLVSLPGNVDQFTPDGKGLVTHGREATVLLVRGFYIDLAELVALAQSRVMRSLTPLECQQYLHTPQCPAQ